MSATTDKTLVDILRLIDTRISLLAIEIEVLKKRMDRICKKEKS